MLSRMTGKEGDTRTRLLLRLRQVLIRETEPVLFPSQVLRLAIRRLLQRTEATVRTRQMLLLMILMLVQLLLKLVVLGVAVCILEARQSAVVLLCAIVVLL